MYLKTLVHYTQFGLMVEGIVVIVHNRIVNDAHEGTLLTAESC